LGLLSYCMTGRIGGGVGGWGVVVEVFGWVVSSALVVFARCSGIVWSLRDVILVALSGDCARADCVAGVLGRCGFRAVGVIRGLECVGGVVGGVQGLLVPK